MSKILVGQAVHKSKNIGKIPEERQQETLELD